MSDKNSGTVRCSKFSLIIELVHHRNEGLTGQVVMTKLYHRYLGGEKISVQLDAERLRYIKKRLLGQLGVSNKQVDLRVFPTVVILTGREAWRFVALIDWAVARLVPPQVSYLERLYRRPARPR